MNLPYRYRGLGLLALLVLALPWAAWRFALSDTFGAWRECGRLERRLDALAPTTPATGAAVPDGIEIRTAQLTLTGPFAELLRTVDALERHLPACRMRSAEWQTVVQPRTRRTQLTLTLHIQQLTLITESK